MADQRMKRWAIALCITLLIVLGFVFGTHAAQELEEEWIALPLIVRGDALVQRYVEADCDLSIVVEYQPGLSGPRCAFREEEIDPITGSIVASCGGGIGAYFPACGPEGPPNSCRDLFELTGDCPDECLLVGRFWAPGDRVRFAVWAATAENNGPATSYSAFAWFKSCTPDAHSWFDGVPCVADNETIAIDESDLDWSSTCQAGDEIGLAYDQFNSNLRLITAFPPFVNGPGEACLIEFTVRWQELSESNPAPLGHRSEICGIGVCNDETRPLYMGGCGQLGLVTAPTGAETTRPDAASKPRTRKQRLSR